MGDKVDFLYEPDGAELHWDGLKDKPQPQQASLSGPAPSFASHHTQRQGMQGTQMDATRHLKAKPHNQPMTQEDLMAKAQRMLAEQEEQKNAQLGAGPAVSDAQGKMLPAWLTRQGY